MHAHIQTQIQIQIHIHIHIHVHKDIHIHVRIHQHVDIYESIPQSEGASLRILTDFCKRQYRLHWQLWFPDGC